MNKTGPSTPDGETSTARPRRRTQVERSDETRARVLEATVQCIVADGFASTGLAGIARRAGVTTGAIQHQFGDKSTLMQAVVEEGFDRLTAGIGDLPSDPASLHERVREFVAVLWRGFAAEQTRASLEILLALRSDPSFHGEALAFLGRVRRRIDRMWMGIFWDLAVERTSHVEAQRLIFTTLNGLALERLVLSPSAEPTRDLDRLVGGVLRLLGDDSDPV